MKKTELIFLGVVFVASAAFAGFSLKMTGSLVYIGAGDYNEAVRGRNNYIAVIASGSPEGSFDPLHFGERVDGELIWQFDKNFGLGLGLGNLRVSTNSSVKYRYPTTGPTLLFGGTTAITTKLRAVPIVLSFHYLAPLTRSISWTADVGCSLYLCAFDYRYDFVGGYSGAVDWTERQTFAANKAALGIQGAVGLEIPLSQSIWTVIGVGGHLAKISDLRGDWTKVFNSPENRINGNGDDAYFTTWDRTPGNNVAYRDMAFDNNIRSNQPNYRKGMIDLSGFAITAGIRVVF